MPSYIYIYIYIYVYTTYKETRPRNTESVLSQNYYPLSKAFEIQKKTIRIVGKEWTIALKSLNLLEIKFIENIFCINMMADVIKKNAWNKRYSKFYWNK